MFIVRCVDCNMVLYAKSETSVKRNKWKKINGQTVRWRCPYCLGRKVRSLKPRFTKIYSTGGFKRQKQSEE